MAVEYWAPFRDAVSPRDAMNALFQDSFVRPGNAPAQNAYAALPLSRRTDLHTRHAAWLDRPVDDATLRRQLDLLLKAHEEAGGFLGSSAKAA